MLRHPLLSARLQLCRPSLYLPVWWEPGKHDRDLLMGAARHGLNRTDFYILNDPQLSFLEAHRNYVRGQPAHLHPQSHQHTPPPGLSPSLSQLPHCCLYDSGQLSPQPPEYPHSAPSSAAHPHPPSPPLDAQDSPAQSPGVVPEPRVDFLDCTALEEPLELGALQHDSLHGGKASKDALNGFPFNSAAAAQSMLNSYTVGGADLDSKLRSDVLVGEQGSSEETGLMAPSVELNPLQVNSAEFPHLITHQRVTGCLLQAPWEGADHSSPAEHMFHESDSILGPSTLETGFLEEEEDDEDQGRNPAAEEGGSLEECLGLPPSSPPSHPSTGDSVEPLSSTYILFKVGSDVCICFLGRFEASVQLRTENCSHVTEGWGQIYL